MTSKAAVKIAAETEQQRADFRYRNICRYQRYMRDWDIHADDQIVPLTPVTREIFEAGITVFAYLRPSMGIPDEYAFVLMEFCACYRHGLIAIAVPPPSEVLDESPRYVASEPGARHDDRCSE